MYIWSDHSFINNYFEDIFSFRMDGDEEESTQWSDLPGIPQFLIENLKSNEYETPFRVQVAVISHFFTTTSDLAIGYPTGSGKTLSYLIPIISSLYKRVVPRIRALIVVPNRELATQVFNVASRLIKNSNLSVSVLSTSQNAGAKKKGRSYDILIASASGLSSYLVEVDNTLLRFVEIIVLDEGDLILNQPLENWLDHVQNSLESGKVASKFSVPIKCSPPPDRKIRKILCSATLSRNSKQSEDFRMYAPITLVASDRSRYVVPQGISEQFIVLEKVDKTAALLAICDKLKFVLCFVSTTKRSVTLASIMSMLNPSLSVIEFSSSSSNLQRKKALENITEGQSRLIIATDSLARGVDLPFLNAVVNYDMPYTSRTYVHRMGRTARGGADGICITFLLESELEVFRSVVSKIDGSSPILAKADIKRFLNNRYYEITKRIDKLKVRVGKKAKDIKNAQEDESEEEEENE